MPLDGVRRDALALVAVGLIDHAPATVVLAQPVNLVVHLGDAVAGRAAQLVERALNTHKREIRQPGVVPDFRRVFAKQPHLAVIHDHADDVVGVAFGADEVQRIDAGAVEEGRHPNALTVGLDEHEVAVQIVHDRRAGEIGVGDLREHARVQIVDVACRIGRNHDLRAVVGHADRTRARHRALGGRHPRGGDLVEGVARHDVQIAAVPPQAPDGAKPHSGFQGEAGAALKKRRLLAPFRHHFGEQVDHLAVGRVDAAGDIRGA